MKNLENGTEEAMILKSFQDGMSVIKTFSAAIF
jgi:hypothetical protein